MVAVGAVAGVVVVQVVVQAVVLARALQMVLPAAVARAQPPWRMAFAVYTSRHARRVDGRLYVAWRSSVCESCPWDPWLPWCRSGTACYPPALTPVAWLAWAFPWPCFLYVRSVSFTSFFVFVERRARALGPTCGSLFPLSMCCWLGCCPRQAAALQELSRLLGDLQGLVQCSGQGLEAGPGASGGPGSGAGGGSGPGGPSLSTSVHVVGRKQRLAVLQVRACCGILLASREDNLVALETSPASFGIVLSARHEHGSVLCWALHWALAGAGCHC